MARVSKSNFVSSGDDDEEGSDGWTPGNFECEYCTKMFMTTGGLLKHVQQVKDCREFYGEGRIRDAIQCRHEICIKDKCYSI